jgi:hypothetical protein
LLLFHNALGSPGLAASARLELFGARTRPSGVTAFPRPL